MDSNPVHKCQEASHGNSPPRIGVAAVLSLPQRTAKGILGFRMEKWSLVPISLGDG